MDLEIIEADRTEAANRYRQYAAAAKRRHNVEDEANLTDLERAVLAERF